MVWLVIGAIAVALIFDVINGFHDAANSIATVVSTRVLSPRVAVLWAAFFNFVAMFVFVPRVANTIANIVHITPGEHAFVYVVLAGLCGAIVWDLLTWKWGLPTSSSHALVGGLVGAGLAHGGPRALNAHHLVGTVMFIPLAPLLGFGAGFLVMLCVFWSFRHWRPGAVDRLFRKFQLISSALYCLGHGGNDAQKTMGIILSLLVAAGWSEPHGAENSMPLWIVLSCNAAMALGTAFGGWRIVKTMGMNITKLQPPGGFSAEVAGALVLFGSTLGGIPVSTTHTITGAIVGVGATRSLSRVRWKIAGRIVSAWVMTMPAAALVGAFCYLVIKTLAAQFV